jgi:ligand-binding sensor domain-containing protein
VIAAVTALLLVLFTARPARALDPSRRLSQYVLTSFSTDQGLPQLSVQQIVQSRDGYLWVGTQEGFARFDGFRFTPFDRDSVPGMSSTYISAMIEDRRGRLWVGTREGGIVRLDGATIDLLRQGETLGQGLAGDTICTLAEARPTARLIGTRWAEPGCDGRLRPPRSQRRFQTRGRRARRRERHPVGRHQRRRRGKDGSRRQLDLLEHE